MSRLPIPGQDDNVWGAVLNDFLSVSNNADGTIQPAALHKAGAITSVNGQVSTSGSISLTASDVNAPMTLAEDSDVNITLPINNEVLTYNATSGQWMNATAASGAPLDSSAADIQPLGIRSAGATGFAADAGHVHIMPRLDQISNPTSPVTLNAQKITGLANGAVSTDAAAFGQIPTASTGITNTSGAWSVAYGTTSGTAVVGNDSRITGAIQSGSSVSGDLSGTLPSPTVAKINGVSAPASSPTGSGQVLTSTSSSATSWQAPASAPVTSVAGKVGVVTLATTDLTDTSIVSPSNNQVLAYNTSSSKWVNQTPSLGSATLAGDSDVTLSSPSNNQVLTYSTSSGKWINQTPSSGVSLDTTAGDIQPLGSQAAGNAGLAADAKHVHPMPRLDQISNPTSPVTLNAQKITGLANGAVSTDAAAFGQIPTAGTGSSNFTAGNATVSGDLSGTLPSPTVAKINGVSISGPPTSSQILVATSGTAAAWSTPSAGTLNAAQVLVPTGVKTGAYSAASGNFIPVDTTGGSVTITLPTAPADETRVAVKMIATTSPNTVTIAAGGSDVFNKAAGSTSVTLNLLGQGIMLQYAAASAIWYVQSDDLPLSQLDARYPLDTATPGGDLSGTYASPTVAKVNGVSISGTPATGRAIVASSSSAAAWSSVPGTTDWLNAKSQYGATGNGSTDDTTAILSALNACPTGGVVYLPAGTYVTSAPIIVPPTVTLLGSHGTHLDTISTSIMPSASFSGAAVIQMVDQTTGGYATESWEQRIYQLSINGTNLPGGNTVDGIQFTGLVHGVYLQDIYITAVGGHGMASVTNSSGTSYSHRGHRIVVNASGSYGYSLSMTDCTWTDLQAIACGGTSHGGFFIGTCGNCHFTDCRAEWSGLSGFLFSGSTGTGTGSGGATFTNCSTDRNTANGFSITSSGNAPLIFNGCMARRDGRNAGSGGAGYAGFNVAGATCPVVINGITVYPGVDDNGTATNSPQYGVSVTGSTYVALNSGWIHAATTAINSGGNTVFRINPNVGTATGTTSSPTFNYNNPWATDNGSTFTTNLNANDQTAIKITQAAGYTNTNNALMYFQSGNSGGDNLIKASVSGDTSSRFVVYASGQMNWGPGSAAVDTDLYRNGTGALKTDGSLVVNTGLGVGQTAPSAGIGTVVGSSVALSLQTSVSGGSGNSSPLILAQGADTQNRVLSTDVTGDANSRFTIYTDGTTSWGAGATVRDIQLQRTAAGTLTYSPINGQTDASLVVSSGNVVINPIASQVGLVVEAASAQTSDLQEWQNSTGSPVVKIDYAGNFTTAGTTITAGLNANDQTGIKLNQAGGNTNLNNAMMTYQSGTNGNDYVLKGGAYGDTNSRFGITSGGKMNWGSGSASYDTNLYRSAAGVLQSDTVISGEAFSGVGITGATAASRYVGATISGAPVSGTFNSGDFIVDRTGTMWICTLTGSPGTWAPLAMISANTFTGTQTAPAFSASGLTGATAGGRFVGATTSGIPVSGVFLTGDFVIDQSGAIWVCTAGGSQGTWAKAQSTNATTSSTGVVELAGDLSGTATSPTVVNTHLAAALPINQGGTNAITTAAAYNNLSPMTSTGDMEYESSTGVAARLPGNITLVPMYLVSTGTSTVATAPAWQRPVTWQPNDHGMITWSFDPASINATLIIPTAGQVNLIKLHVPTACTITNVIFSISAAGATLTASQNFAALYTSAGSLLSATADQSTNWTTTGVKIMALSAAQAVAAGDYYLAFYANGTTLPTPRTGGNAGSMANANLSLANSRFATADTGKTTAMPATLAAIAAQAVSWFGAFS
jgi:hypothetical protein